MAEVWELPDLDRLKPSRLNWFLNLLHTIPENQLAMMLLTVWRTWHAHNELTHDKPYISIEGVTAIPCKLSELLVDNQTVPAYKHYKGQDGG
jgi:hypothetical protein